MIDAYYLKTLYFSAGKHILEDNYLYFRQLMKNKELSETTEAIYQCSSVVDNVSVKDRYSAVSDIIIRHLSEHYGEKSDVFLYRDDQLFSAFSAVYICKTGFFLFNDKFDTDRCSAGIYVCRCYKRERLGKYTSEQLADIAKEYFEKSECIDNTLLL